MKPSSATPSRITINTIERWEMENIGVRDDNFRMMPDPDGEFVKYEDAVRLVEALRSEIAGSDIKHDMARILQISCDADEVSATKLLHEISEIASKHPWPETVAPEAQEQLTFMSRQAELLDEQGHDVSANVMRDCMKVLVRTMTERDQQTRFKYEANLRADRAEERLSASARKNGRTKLVYNKATRMIDQVRDGQVVESFAPPEELG